MRIFVTGGTGLIGRRLIAALTDRGDEVVVLSRLAAGHGFDDADVAVVQGDPAQPGEWQASLAGMAWGAGRSTWLAGVHTP